MKQLELISVEKISLFEHLCEKDTLSSGFRSVKKNRGSHGIDNVSIEEFEQNLDEQLDLLSEELRRWIYKPMPVRRVEIPKPGSKEKRKLGVPAVRDRVVQASIAHLLEPILDPMFSDSSYGFRPGRSPHDALDEVGRSQRDAVQAASFAVKSGKEVVVDIDLSKFFDRINHDRLIGRLGLVIPDKRILRLIGMTLRCGVKENGKVISTPVGTTQGSPLSPLLSNFVLHELDMELERRNLEFCRWADDCNIFVGTMKAGHRVMNSIQKFIETKLKLKVNIDKSKVALSRQVKFLGMTIVAGTIAISAKSMVRARLKLSELIPRGSHLPIEVTIENYNKWYKGWSNYFKMTNYPSQLHVIEAHARRRMRSRLMGDLKRRKFISRRLRQLGVKPHTADKVVFSNKGRWALSGHAAIHKAYPVKWFTSRGQHTQSNLKLDHWFETSKWIKLT